MQLVICTSFNEITGFGLYNLDHYIDLESQILK